MASGRHSHDQRFYRDFTADPRSASASIPRSHTADHFSREREFVYRTATHPAATATPTWSYPYATYSRPQTAGPSGSGAFRPPPPTPPPQSQYYASPPRTQNVPSSSRGWTDPMSQTFNRAQTFTGPTATATASGSGGGMGEEYIGESYNRTQSPQATDQPNGSRPDQETYKERPAKPKSQARRRAKSDLPRSGTPRQMSTDPSVSDHTGPPSDFGLPPKEVRTGGRQSAEPRTGGSTRTARYANDPSSGGHSTPHASFRGVPPQFSTGPYSPPPEPAPQDSFYGTADFDPQWAGSPTGAERRRSGQRPSGRRRRTEWETQESFPKPRVVRVDIIGVEDVTEQYAEMDRAKKEAQEERAEESNPWKGKKDNVSVDDQGFERPARRAPVEPQENEEVSTPKAEAAAEASKAAERVTTAPESTTEGSARPTVFIPTEVPTTAAPTEVPSTAPPTAATEPAQSTDAEVTDAGFAKARAKEEFKRKMKARQAEAGQPELAQVPKSAEADGGVKLGEPTEPGTEQGPSIKERGRESPKSSEATTTASAAGASHVDSAYGPGLTTSPTTDSRRSGSASSLTPEIPIMGSRTGRRPQIYTRQGSGFKEDLGRPIRPVPLQRAGTATEIPSTPSRPRGTERSTRSPPRGAGAGLGIHVSEADSDPDEGDAGTPLNPEAHSDSGSHSGASPKYKEKGKGVDTDGSPPPRVQSQYTFSGDRLSPSQRRFSSGPSNPGMERQGPRQGYRPSPQTETQGTGGAHTSGRSSDHSPGLKRKPKFEFGPDSGKEASGASSAENLSSDRSSPRARTRQSPQKHSRTPPERYERARRGATENVTGTTATGDDQRPDLPPRPTMSEGMSRQLPPSVFDHLLQDYEAARDRRPRRKTAGQRSSGPSTHGAQRSDRAGVPPRGHRGSVDDQTRTRAQEAWDGRRVVLETGAASGRRRSTRVIEETATRPRSPFPSTTNVRASGSNTRGGSSSAQPPPHRSGSFSSWLRGPSSDWKKEGYLDMVYDAMFDSGDPGRKYEKTKKKKHRDGDEDRQHRGHRKR